MTIQTAVLIETLVALGAEVRWGQLQHLLHPGPRGRRGRGRPDGTPDGPAGRAGVRLEGRDARGVLVVHRPGARAGPASAGPNMILDDGGDATLLVHKGVEFEKAGAVPAPTADDSEEYAVVLELLAAASLATSRAGGPAIAEGIRGVTEETTTGVHRLYEMPRPARCCSRRSTSTTRSPSRSSTTSTAAGTAHRRHQPGHRRDDRRQGRRRLRLRRRRQGLRGVAARPGRPGRSSPRSTRSARCRRRWTASRSSRSTTSSTTADIFITTTGNKDIITADAHGPDEAQGHRRQHRPLRQRDRHGRPGRACRASRRSRSSRRSHEWTFADGHRSSCCPRAAC